jgi:hypothetical protein
MGLPDRAEQVGIVVGSALLVALPAGHLGSIVGIEIGSWLPTLIFLVPGLVIGGLIVTDRLPATYIQVWAFSLVSWILAAAGWSAFGVQYPIPGSERPIALGVWTAAIVVGALYAWARPVSVAKRRLLAG